MSKKRALVLGAAGFIGAHLVDRLKSDGYWVRGVDRIVPLFTTSTADDFVIADLRDRDQCQAQFDQPFEEVYQLAAEMGGAGYIFSGSHDFDILMNSARINLNVAAVASEAEVERLLFTSSACVYNQMLQKPGLDFHCRESDAYPAFPDSEYGWEKLFAERAYTLLDRASGPKTRIARLHNVYGPQSAWCGGREKSPAAFCRKVAEAPQGGTIIIWGDGQQIRSFLYIDDCLDGLTRLMRSDLSTPLNIGSDTSISIRELAEMTIAISGKRLSISYAPGPLGVAARSSDNTLVNDLLGWTPQVQLLDGMRLTYSWIESQVHGHSGAVMAPSLRV